MTFALEPSVWNLRCFDAAIFAFLGGIVAAVVGVTVFGASVILAVGWHERAARWPLSTLVVALLLVPTFWAIVTRGCGNDGDVTRWLWLWTVAEALFFAGTAAVIVARRRR